jgi:crotonobetainyl-CoA:carnitine CoA-transferase CaiB-like acyl-CoA transferase
VIVAGAEAGRLLGDQGADVIKIENRAYPDSTRVRGMQPYYASSQRNKRSLGLNLRDPKGAVLFEELVRQADVVLSNFKPGTLDSLGFGYNRLADINPKLVVSISSAMGDWGPWRNWMGYGPLIRGVSGLSSLWRDDEVEDGFADGTTIFPDHFMGRVIDVAVLAALIGGIESGHGACIETAQAEVVLMSLSATFLRASLERQGLATDQPDPGVPWGIYPCAGDDEWCVITVRDDEMWAGLVEAMGRPAWALDEEFRHDDNRWRRRLEINDHLTRWTSERSPTAVTQALQAAGVAAGPMVRTMELMENPQLAARQFFRKITQPGLDEPVRTENGPARFLRHLAPVLRPAPYLGEQTREICREVLGMSDAETDALLASGVLEDPTIS